jgi:hypothetical protein
LLALTAPTGAVDPVTYDRQAGRWVLDVPAVVSRNDTVYTTPSTVPWEAMPVGGGDLSAMVCCDGAKVDLHLTKSDAWGFLVPPDTPVGSRFFNNVSPGHLRLVLGPQAQKLARERFRQRLDLYRGRIVVELGAEQTGARLEIWGHPERKILLVEVSDPVGALAPLEIELSEWRSTMKLTADAATIRATEIHTRPARPHLANTGMQDFLPNDPLLGRGTAVAVGVAQAKVESCRAEEKKATMTLAARPPANYTLVIAAAVEPHGDLLPTALSELKSSLATPLEQLKGQHQAWWQDWWSRSFLQIESPDRMAERLCGAYHVHLYTLACVNRGAVPCKWDGGAGLLQGDERNWGLAEWVQEVRFTYLPLYAANRLEMARGLTRHYGQMRPYLLEQTERVWGLDGLWIPETVLPWGHAEDYALQDAGVLDSYRRWDPKTARYGRFERFNNYVGFLFTAGLEICQHYLTYARYSGDETFLHDEAYPTLRGVCQFLAGLLHKEDDGRYHLDPANALETWWLVRDPDDTLSGIRVIFPEFIRLSEQYGQDADLADRCRAILATLAEPTLGQWNQDGSIDPNLKVYAPAARKGPFPKAENAENPALYRVFPFGLSGIDTPDHELAVNTFEHRIFGITNSWSLDAVWAARLGLAERATELVGQHATRYHRFRYGGWDSSNSDVLPDDLSVAPYMDGAGLSAFAVNEMLLQSHGDMIRLLPAVSSQWSGIFSLRAEGGFLVTAQFAGGKPRLVEIQSLLGGKCRVRNPYPAAAVHCGQKRVLRSEGPVLEFDTAAGASYLIEPAP